MGHSLSILCIWKMVMYLTSGLIPDYFAIDCFLLTTLEFHHQNQMKNLGPDSSFKDVTPESKFAKSFAAKLTINITSFYTFPKDLFNLTLV